MISLIHPSRGRKDKSVQTVRNWIQKAKHPHNIEVIVSVDTSDPTHMDYVKNVFMHEYNNGVVFSIQAEINNNHSVVEATNNAAKVSTGEILIYLSDDFNCPEEWDELVIKEFDGVTKPMMLKVDDCLQKFSVGVLTCPIMNRQLRDLLGYFFNPLYKSMHVDVDLFETTKRFIKYAPHLKFPHDHHSLGKCENDETYRRSERNWNQGLEVINKRRRQGFPI